MKKLLQLVLMIMLVMGMSVASQAGVITVGSATGDPGAAITVPITINNTEGQPDVSFSVSFDTTKLQYTGRASGTMDAQILDAGTSAINTAGKFQPLVQFAEGGATSGTICSMKFTIKTGAAAGVTPLTIADIARTQFTGVNGQVTINAAACTGPTITVATVQACDSGTQVQAPITIDSTAGQPDVSFSVSFDNTKLQYTGRASGTMDAQILDAGTSAINAAGKFQPLVQFAEGGATSGTICSMKFTLLSAIAAGADTPLTIGDIARPEFCGESGAVECAEIPACTVTVDPQTATVLAGGTKTFTATTTGSGCNTPVYAWSITTAIGSTITAEGKYTAGSIQTGTATDTVTATDSANGNAKGSAVITVRPVPPPRCTVSISPESATVDCGNTVQFSAVTTGTACATPAYTWEVTSTIGSTITENGLYTAGNNQTGSAKTDTVRVTDTANNDSASSKVTVNDCTIVCLALTVDPAESAQGQTLKVKLTPAEKIFKNVNKDDIIVDFGSGITVNKITDKSEGSIKVEITIDANATVGTRTVLVTVSDTVCGEGTFGVTKAPTIVIAPPYGNAGATIETVTITGRNTHFAKDKCKVTFGDKIEVDKKTIVDENTITVKIKIKDKAVTGSRTVTVTTNLGNDLKEVANGTFTVLPPQ